jgi:hypothetical protein
MKCKHPDCELSPSEIQEYMDRNECHLCRNGARGGSVDKRASLLAHWRKTKDPAHRLWRATYWSNYISKGGDMVNRELTPEQVRKAILTTFPEVTELEFEMVQ